MATYKVIQDIEAEDKLVGPLSLRQFIYAGIAVLCGYIAFICISKNVGLLAIPFFPPMLFCAFFAFPWSREQSTEIWALAKIRFFLKPRRRIWDQSGVKELVTITVPKKIERTFTNGLSQNEVKSRLNALASTIDSRGWAIKNVDANLYSQPLVNPGDDSDRLVGLSNMPQQVVNNDVMASDDMLDEQNNPVAQQFSQMIAASDHKHREQIEQQLQQPVAPPAPVAPAAAAAAAGTPPADYWFLNQPAEPPQLRRGTTTFNPPQVIVPGIDDQQGFVHAADPTPSEEAFAKQLEAQNSSPQPSYSHLKTIAPPGTTPPTDNTQVAQAQVTPPPIQPAQPMTPAPDPAKIDLARNNDLSVATIARLANHQDKPDEPDEVVISLR